MHYGRWRVHGDPLITHKPQAPRLLVPMGPRPDSCLECGAPLEPFDGRGRPRLTCSGDCRNRRHERLKRERLGKPEVGERQCLACGVPVVGRSDKVFCSVLCRKRTTHNQTPRGPRKSRYMNSNGYVEIVTAAGGKQLEHRMVMESILGRHLLRHENVHHINGVRDDNRPENLELWSTSQPAGQRVVDKVAWALAMIDQYPDVVATLRPPLRLFTESA